MDNIDIFNYEFWKPFKAWGIDSGILFINSETVVNTWIILIVLFISLLFINYFFKRNNKIIIYLASNLINIFKDFSIQTLGKFVYAHFALVASLFIFIFLCNSIGLIPNMEEPTVDLNTTLSLAIISFLYIQINSIKAIGIKSYFSDFFSPFFLMFPLNVIGKLSNIVSMSFRLFGNIFGGSIISKIYLQFVASSIFFEVFGLFSGLNFIIIIFFGLFEGFIQAFVFSMLTLTYLSVALQGAPLEKEVV